MQRAVESCGLTPVSVPHGRDDLGDIDAAIVAGVLPRSSSRLIQALVERAGRGLPVLGIGTGFHVLCESELLTGTFDRNASQTFVCREQRVRIETSDTVWTVAFEPASEITLVLRNGQGNFRADAKTIAELEGEDRIVCRYVGDHPTGSIDDIAGITNAAGNVVGMMLHPEFAVDELTGPTLDGRTFFASIESFLVRAGV